MILKSLLNWASPSLLTDIICFAADWQQHLIPSLRPFLGHSPHSELSGLHHSSVEQDGEGFGDLHKGSWFAWKMRNVSQKLRQIQTSGGGSRIWIRVLWRLGFLGHDPQGSFPAGWMTKAGQEKTKTPRWWTRTKIQKDHSTGWNQTLLFSDSSLTLGKILN